MDIAHAKVVCRVQIAPMHDGPDPSNDAHDSFVLELPIQIMEERQVKSDLEDFEERMACRRIGCRKHPATRSDSPTPELCTASRRIHHGSHALTPPRRTSE